MLPREGYRTSPVEGRKHTVRVHLRLLIVALILAVQVLGSGQTAAGSLTWATGPSMGTEPLSERVQVAASAAGGMIYATGGFNGPFVNGNTLNRVQEFNFVTNA